MQPPGNAPPAYIAPADEDLSPRPGDSQIPNMDVVQTNAGYRDELSERYIPGAEVGDLVAPLTPVPVYNGETGIEIVPVTILVTYVEWLEGRQGFVARHSQKPADAIMRISQNDGRSRTVWARPCGTLLVETWELYLLHEALARVIWCSSSRITPVRQLGIRARQHPHPNGGVLPLYAFKYCLRTVAKKNALGRWFNIKFDRLDYVSKLEYDAAEALRGVISRGALCADPSTIDAE
jgi:hypothetical protein